MRRYLFTAIMGISAVGIIAGCGPSKAEERAAEQAAEKRKDDVVARYTPDVKKKVAQVDKVRALLPTIPAAEEGAPVPNVTPPIKLSELHDKDSAANGDVMMEADLTLLQRGIIGSCSYHVRSGGEGLGEHLAEEIFSGCLKIRYFLVVRPNAKVKARLAGSDTYDGGEISGDVLVFELPAEGDPRLAGAFPIDVVLTGKVTVRGNADRDRVEYELNEALRKELLTAIEKKFSIQK